MQKFLIIQTAFIGDVILATSLVEKLYETYPDAKIDFLLRKGNQGLLQNHPFIRKLYVFDKTQGKYHNLISLVKQLKAEQYDYIINAQRFFTTGVITYLSKGKVSIGFDKNPLSPFFKIRKPHKLENTHEIERNHLLISDITDSEPAMPKLYPSVADFEKMRPVAPYICLAPTSVWFTKQYPTAKWIQLLNNIPPKYTVYLLGSLGDWNVCQAIAAGTRHKRIENMAGQLSFLQSAALMAGSAMNYVNDSAPLHIASAMNAPVTAVFCSTVPEFGFTPLSTKSTIVQTREKLNCRPCGLHGHRKCPKKHFACANTIELDDLLAPLNQ